jgi:hypothetical protein
MSLSSFSDNRVQEVIERFGSARKASIIAGAGASVEAGLPDWRELICRVLRRAGLEKGLFQRHDTADPTVDGDALDRWVEETLDHDFLSGAASTAEQLLLEPLETCVKTELFKDPEGHDRAPSNVTPGPIAREIAFWRATLESQVPQTPQANLRILTTNYDDLILQALKDREDLSHYDIYPRVYPPDREPHAPLKVRHLHGYIGRDKTAGTLVLTGDSYYSPSPAKSERESSIKKSLAQGPCLFVGTSLTDFNVTQFLYFDEVRNQQHRHTVVFVRQADDADEPRAVRAAREQAAIDTWGAEQLDVLFLDHFSDVSQLLHEIGLRRKLKDDYRSVTDRANTLLSVVHRDLLCSAEDDDDEFFDAQKRCNRQLREIMSDVVTEMVPRGVSLGDEAIAIAVWFFDPEGSRMAPWIASDRVHRETGTLQSVDLDFPTRWVAVKAACGGGRVDERKARHNSRWRYLVGLPLDHIDNDGCRTPLGAITMSSLAEDSELQLNPENVSRQADLSRLVETLVRDAISTCIDPRVADSMTDQRNQAILNV